MRFRPADQRVKPPDAASARSAWGILIGTLLLLAAGVVVYALLAPSVDAIGLQVAGSSGRANQVVGGRTGDFRAALWWDFALIAAYTVALAWVCDLGRKVFWTLPLHRAATAARNLAVAGGALNVAQDVVLLILLRRVPMHGAWAFRIVQGVSFAKFSALLVAGSVGICAWGTALGRLAFASSNERKLAKLGSAGLIPPPPTEGCFRADPSPVAKSITGAGEPAGHWHEDARIPPGRPAAHIGVCVSGGGVRAGSVALGALQALRDAGQLLRARYLLSVSGGGFLVGAFQLALKSKQKDATATAGEPDGVAPEPKEEETTTATPEDVFAPGSLEEDHVRRHSSYLSDGPSEWLVALGVMLRGVLSSLVVIALTVAFAGLATGWFYRVTRIADLRRLRRYLLEGGPSVNAGPRFAYPTRGVAIVIGALVVLAVLLYLARVLSASSTGHRTGKLASASNVATASALLFALVGAGIPAVVWASVWLTWHAGWRTTPGTVATTGAATGGLMYVGTLLSALWRKRKAISSPAGRIRGLFSKKPTGLVVPNSMAQMLLLWICTLVVIAALVVVSGWVAASGIDRSWWALLPVAALGLGVVLFDQTAMSMHPFYRRRLASAFAVRRGARRGEPVAIPYDYEKEGTLLWRYAQQVAPFPKVIFCAAANLTGQDVTPPGRRTVSYTLADDFIGGPQIGWVNTEKLQELVGVSPIGRDLTVEAAVAISGAAFASAMGSQTRFFEVFLALSNARLGAWLPNPGFLARKRDHLKDWTVPGLPRIRRLSYFAREVLGIHPSTSRLLLCTDGGHYDNLGLVELLRHRCRLIYCIDATGDTPPLATTLAQAITLAHEELGVTISLRANPLDVVPGSAIPLDPADPLHPLNVRLSKGVVIIGDITYPNAVTYPNDPERKFDELTSRAGLLVVAKAALAPDLPYELLSYALDDPAFPRDGTADQWFNCEQFDAYQGLGRELGERASKAAAGAKDIQGRPIFPPATGNPATAGRASSSSP